MQFFFAHNNKLVSKAKVKRSKRKKLALRRNNLHIVAITLICKLFIYRYLQGFLQGKKN